MDRKLPPKDTTKFLIDLDDYKKLDSEYTTTTTVVTGSWFCSRLEGLTRPNRSAEEPYEVQETC
jgi:hypothetical protein